MEIRDTAGLETCATCSLQTPALFPTLVALLLLLCEPAIEADDWPQWRGSQRDGVWRETGLIKKFPGKQIESKWRLPIGSGYSGPTVADGKVFVTDRVPEPQQLERIWCVDAKTGKPLWRHEYVAEYTIGYRAGPRASVSVDQQRAFALGAMGYLHCLDVRNGKVLWKRDLKTDYDVTVPTFGISAAPLIHGDLLIVQVGGANGSTMVAFNKTDGKEEWRALNEKASYSAPILIRQAKRDVLVVWMQAAIAGLDPLTGKIHWREELERQRPPNVATPIVQDELIFLTSFYNGSFMFRLPKDRLAIDPVWQKAGPSEVKTEALHSIISTPLFQGDHVYGVDAFGQMRCLEAATGERVWEDLTVTPRSRFGTIHFVKQADKIWMFNERGELIISRLSPGGFEELSRAKLIDPTREQNRTRDGVCWSHPAFANRHVFIRNDKELICASLAAN